MEIIHLDDIFPEEIKTYYQKDLIKKYGEQSFFWDFLKRARYISQ